MHAMHSANIPRSVGFSTGGLAATEGLPTSGELALGVLWDLHDEHVACGSPHDLGWNGAEFMTLRGAQSAVTDHNKTPVIGSGSV